MFERIKSILHVCIWFYRVYNCLIIAMRDEVFSFRAEKYGIALSIIAVLATIIPATDIAVNFVNWVLCKMIKPSLLQNLTLKTEYLKSMPQWLSYLLCFLTRIGRGAD